jgi:hypothetical protein
MEALNSRIDQANELLEGAVLAYKLGAPPKTIPPESIPVESTNPVEFADIIDLWAAERSVRPDSRRSATAHIRRLTDFLGHTDMARLTKDDIVQFRGALLKSGKVTERTVANHLITIRTLFNFAVPNGKIGSNPAKASASSPKPIPRRSRKASPFRDRTAAAQQRLHREAAGFTDKPASSRSQRPTSEPLSDPFACPHDPSLRAHRGVKLPPLCSPGNWAFHIFQSLIKSGIRKIYSG